jgi:hypothetical protein
MKLQTLLRLLLATTLMTISWACSDDEPIEAINKLRANAGLDQQVNVNNEVLLDGSNSFDGAQKPFDYRWSFKSKPQASAAILNDAATARPRFTADVAGLYILELKITQGQFSSTDQVSVLAKVVDNSPATIQLRENITSETMLQDIFEDPAKPDYLVTKDIVVSAKLTIAQGVVIAFEENKSLQIYPDGILIAKGTPMERVYFTGKVKQKGYWKGILFLSSNVQNELENVSVEFGGSTPLPEMGMIKANIALAGNAYSGSTLNISNSTIYGSGGYGLYIAGRSQLNYFFANYFNDNTLSAVYVPAAQLHKVDFFTHYTGNNGFNGVETGGVIHSDTEVTWSYFNDGSKYLVTEDLVLESGVKISEGASFEFASNVMLKVTPTGYLNASGSDFKPVTFAARQKTPNSYWKGIYFASGNASNTLLYTNISHAGSSQMPDMNDKANVAVAPGAKVLIQHSTLEKGLGWGLVAAPASQFNDDIATANLYVDFVDGYYKLPTPPETPTLAGEWLDLWSFQRNRLTLADNYYNESTGTWFNGSANPWEMPAGGFGLKVNSDGSYRWTIAERSPWTGTCISYSAEYITGSVTSTNTQLTFNESYWRSKFYNSCDEDQNVDTEVETGSMTLRYEINRMYNLWTGAAYWELKIINPDNSFFAYYKN